MSVASEEVPPSPPDLKRHGAILSIASNADALKDFINLDNTTDPPNIITNTLFSKRGLPLSSRHPRDALKLKAKTAITITSYSREDQQADGKPKTTKYSLTVESSKDATFDPDLFLERIEEAEQEMKEIKEMHAVGFGLPETMERMVKLTTFQERRETRQRERRGSDKAESDFASITKGPNPRVLNSTELSYCLAEEVGGEKVKKIFLFEEFATDNTFFHGSGDGQEVFNTHNPLSEKWFAFVAVTSRNVREPIDSSCSSSSNSKSDELSSSSS